MKLDCNWRTYSPEEIEQIVVDTRLHLYNGGYNHGAYAIAFYLEPSLGLQTPSASTVHRILVRHGLTHGRTGLYDDNP